MNFLKNLKLKKNQGRPARKDNATFQECYFLGRKVSCHILFSVTLRLSSFEDFELKLGEGAFSEVKEAISRENRSNSYAVKIVTVSKLTNEDKVALRDEIDILNELAHPHIIKLFRTFNEPSYIFLVTELLSGGELFDYIVKH